MHYPSFEAVYEVQKKLMKSWPGRALNQDGTLRVMNENGTRRPLFWVFNGAAEPDALRRVLNPNQPLIFTRSSHLLKPPENQTINVNQALSFFIENDLNSAIRGSPFDAGANCQGTALISNLCKSSKENGLTFRHLCLINCRFFSIKTHANALLVYGSEDQRHDPFVSEPHQAHNDAEFAFDFYRRTVVTASHGQFLYEENAREIMKRFTKFKARARFSSSRKLFRQFVNGWE